jgi:hypothetical protein
VQKVSFGSFTAEMKKLDNGAKIWAAEAQKEAQAREAQGG